MEIFDEFIVVEEKAISKLTVQNTDDGNWSFQELTEFASLQFAVAAANSLDYPLKIKDIGNASSSKPPNLEPLAQIIRWNWDKNGAQRIVDTHTLNKGSEINCRLYALSFVIRILKKRSPFPAPSKSSTDHDQLTVKIGDKQIAVSAHWLMSVSPVISRMLSVEMKEKQQRMITLDELGVDMDQFMEFLENIKS